MKNNGKVILDLCGGTGAWSEPYRKAGYLVHNVTLSEWDVREHIFDAEMGTLEFQSQINEKLVLRVHLNAIHGILAAPPCTEFSLAKTTKPRRTVMSAPIFLQKTNNGVRKRDGKKLKSRNAAWYANATPAQRAITPAGFSKAFFKANP